MDNAEDNIPESDKIEINLLSYCKSGNYKQVVYLFDKYFDNPGFDINCRDGDDNTPVILAAKHGHGSIVQEILRFQPDLTLENRRGQTVMHLSTNVVRKMIFGSASSCLRYCDRLFCNCCWLGNAEFVERSLARGDQVRLEGGGPKSVDGRTCLELTVKSMSTLEKIAVSTRCVYRPAQVLQSLLSHSPSPRVHLINGEYLNYSGDEILAKQVPLLHIAASHICNAAVEVARVILKRNSREVNERDEIGFTAIHVAARSGNAAVLELLLVASNANSPNVGINAQASAGSTPLHLAAAEGRENCVRLLLSHGASTELTNSANLTPVQLAKSVRIKNIFSQMAGDPMRSRPTPDLPIVLSRPSSTSIAPVTPKSKVSREKSSSSPQIAESRQSLAISPDLPRNFCTKISRSVTLACLIEEPLPSYHSRAHDSDPIDEVFEPTVANDNPPIVNSALHRKRTPFSAKISSAPRLKPVDKANKKFPLTHRDRHISTDKSMASAQKKNAAIKGSKRPSKVNHLRKQIQEVAYESDFHSSSDEDQRDEQLDTYKACRSSSSDCECESARLDDHTTWLKGEQLGKGSYGTVWKGMLEDGQYIAVKEIDVLDPDEEGNDISSDHVTVARNVREIRREIEILRTIRHRNIVKYLGACDSHSSINIFMEFVSGGSIANILLKFGAFPEKIIRIYSRQIVTGVAFLHDRSIVHRDLKGANIMVTPRGVIKLVDFGCAKRLENFSPNSRSLTQQSRLQGSVYWLAPEVINGAAHNHKSDVWSVGCTVIEMITTKPPWCELHPYAAMFAIGMGKRPQLHLPDYICVGGAKLTPEICQFVDLCLTRDVACRAAAGDLLLNSFLK